MTPLLGGTSNAINIRIKTLKRTRRVGPENLILNQLAMRTPRKLDTNQKRIRHQVAQNQVVPKPTYPTNSMRKIPSDSKFHLRIHRSLKVTKYLTLRWTLIIHKVAKNQGGLRHFQNNTPIASSRNRDEVVGLLMISKPNTDNRAPSDGIFGLRC